MTIFYCIEDQISRAVAERLIFDFCPKGTPAQELGQTYGGYGYIKKNLTKFHTLAQRSPVFIITDLDHTDCAPSLRRNWLQAANIAEPLPDKMLFCVAKTEIESWLLADSTGISAFLKINQSKIANDVEGSIIDSKEYLVGLAKRSVDPVIRADIAPKPKSAAATGLNYNHRLSNFAANEWNPLAASENSVSLLRAIHKLANLVF